MDQVMEKLALVTFDIDTLKAPPDAYKKAYEVLRSFGMKSFKANHLNIVALPSTTVVGKTTMGTAATTESVRDQLLREFEGAGIPITHLLVAFLEEYAGLGEPLVSLNKEAGALT